MNHNVSFEPPRETALHAQIQQDGVVLEEESKGGSSGNVGYWFNSPRQVWYPYSVRREADGFYAENEELSIFAFGETDTEAIEDFISAIEASWEGLKNADDSELTPDAIELRDNLKRYFQI
jgi:hypothetical protein